MTIHSARYTYGVTILFIQFGSIGLYTWNGFRFHTSSDAVADIFAGALMLLPITATYGLTFLRFVVANPVVAKEEKQAPMDWGPFAVQYGIVLIFGLALLGSIQVLFKHETLVGGFENIKIVVGFLETLFGAYMALIFGALFPLAWERQQLAPASTSPNTADSNLDQDGNDQSVAGEP